MVETLFSSDPPVNNYNRVSSENLLRFQVFDGISLEATISQNIKKKICSDEFIDMKHLMYNTHLVYL